jgi:hypothetical protein
VYDPLAIVSQIEELDTECGTVLPQGFHLGSRHGISDFHPIRGRGHIVIHGAESQIRSSNFSVCQAKPLKSLWTCHFVYQVAIDV